MASSLRSRFRSREMEGDPGIVDDDGSATEGESGSTSGDYEAELESMAGKGIKRLCSELLEIKKASDEDFQRSVYSNHSAFVGIFEEVERVENELVQLKQHVSTQRKLVQVLLDNLCSDIASKHSIDINGEESEDLDLSPADTYGTQMYNVLEKLDILLSEQQVEEALVVLETEADTLQRMQIEEDHASPVIMSYMSAISERRTRLADQFASVAEHPRVAAAELQKALSGLCSLGETRRANDLMLKFHRSRLANSIHELECAKPLLGGAYIMDLAKSVFSSISQAARSFVMLHGEASSYGSELIEWAREETETFGRMFRKYVRPISETSGGLSLAVEAAHAALSFCSLLSSQRIVLRPDLVKLIRPSMEDVLHLHANNFKKVIGIFTATDTWVPGTFLVSGILRDKPSLKAVCDELEYCVLTSSARKLVTLIQAFIDDTASLAVLQMEGSILKGLANLFNAYINALERAIPQRGFAVENDHPRISSAQRLPQQISLLVSSSTLMHLCPIIAASVFKGTSYPSDEIPEHAELLLSKEFDSWTMSIHSAVDRLKAYFCQQFVYEIMSYGQSGRETGGDSYAQGDCIPSSSEDSMPSFAFQALFLRLRQLEELSKFILNSKDGPVEKLVTELLKAVIAWLLDKQDFWNDTVDCSLEQQRICYKQFHLDIHFLAETARHYGCCSDDLMDAVLDLITRVELTFTETRSDLNSVVPDDEWVLNATKQAMERLLKVDLTESQLRTEPLAASPDEMSAQIGEHESIPNVEKAIAIQEDFMDIRDCQSEGWIESDTLDSVETKSVESKSPERSRIDERTTDYDDEDWKSTTNDGGDASEADGNGDNLSKIEGSEEANAEEPGAIPEGVGLMKLDELQCTAETENLVKTELPEGSDKLAAAPSLYLNNSEETADIQEDCSKLCHTDAVLLPDVDRSPLDSEFGVAGLLNGESCVMFQHEHMNDFIGANHSSFTASNKQLQDDWPRARDATVTTRGAQFHETEELVCEGTELCIESNSDKEWEEDVHPPVLRSRKTSSSSVRPKVGLGQPRYVSAGRLSGKSRKPLRTHRPRWH